MTLENGKRRKAMNKKARIVGFSILCIISIILAGSYVFMGFMQGGWSKWAFATCWLIAAIFFGKTVKTIRGPWGGIV